MKFLTLLIVSCICFLSAWSCHKVGPSLSLEQVVREQKTFRGQLFLTQGTNHGPYKAGPGFVANPGTAGSFRVLDQSVDYPATPGFFYECYSYSNANNQALIIVRKVAKGDAKAAD